MLFILTKLSLRSILFHSTKAEAIRRRILLEKCLNIGHEGPWGCGCKGPHIFSLRHKEIRWLTLSFGRLYLRKFPFIMVKDVEWTSGRWCEDLDFEICLCLGSNYVQSVDRRLAAWAICPNSTFGQCKIKWNVSGFVHLNNNNNKVKDHRCGRGVTSLLLIQ